MGKNNESCSANLKAASRLNDLTEELMQLTGSFLNDIYRMQKLNDRFPKSELMNPDEAKHILAFDIMYCLDCYVEFSEGIESKKLTMKEKQLYLAMKSKAEELRIEAEQARADSEKLSEAVDAMTELLKNGDSVTHTRFGAGIVEYMEGINAEVRFSDGVKKMNMALSIGNGIVMLNKPDFTKYFEQYSNVLKRCQGIPQALSRAENALRPYEEYLD